MRLGYIRTSSREQTPARQIDALTAKCDRLFIEQVSANKKKRPIFIAVQRRLRAGDTLVIHDLDRAFRSTLEALTVMQRLTQREVALEVLSLNINTGSPEGELLYTQTASYARYEWRILSRRTKEGMEAARARGAKIGRPPVIDQDSLEWARLLIDSGLRVEDAAYEIDAARSTLYRHLAGVNACDGVH